MTRCSSTVRIGTSFLVFDLAWSSHRGRVDSGHGGQVKDTNGDEVDGYDEGWLHLTLLYHVTDRFEPSHLPP